MYWRTHVSAKVKKKKFPSNIFKKISLDIENICYYIILKIEDNKYQKLSKDAARLASIDKGHLYCILKFGIYCSL